MHTHLLYLFIQILEDQLSNEKATVASLKERLANQNPDIKTVESSSPIKTEEATVDEKQTAVAAGAGFGAGMIKHEADYLHC